MQATKSTYLYFLALPISDMGFVSFSAVGLYSYPGKLLISDNLFLSDKVFGDALYHPFTEPC